MFDCHNTWTFHLKNQNGCFTSKSMLRKFKFRDQTDNNMLNGASFDAGA